MWSWQTKQHFIFILVLVEDDDETKHEEDVDNEEGKGQNGGRRGGERGLNGGGQCADEAIPIDALTLTKQDFLVSFMVDARGGSMKGCRYSGVKVSYAILFIYIRVSY